ncbi:hypothetical protein BGW36DRAFT_424181 [Talaromyces proteolyticus]|uniref:Fido domain-containing protein n=1 Tax=Talaromyces proteolyticus TaxID=1131652 RepID=A0AAD4KXZ9_9EURO|nr:uncharacterized protein BGW36DRAFT_424181 [Talaromyces proteolyticus]KAH8701883.1 hypothetical protein BGW36DRAFT_424181 [Talaromyces proteolyticus]
MATTTLPKLMIREDFLDYTNLPPKLLALNNWLFDGSLSDGGKPNYQPHRDQYLRRGEYFKVSELNQGTGAPSRTAIKELSRSAVSLADNQIFVDGNTRMAVFVILEYLASVGVLYSRDPVRIYWILARRESDEERYDPADAVEAVAKEVGDSTYRPNGGVSDVKREEYAQKVKRAQNVWKRIEEINQNMKAALTTEQRKNILQEAKRKNAYIYELYRDIYKQALF